MIARSCTALIALMLLLVPAGATAETSTANAPIAAEATNGASVYAPPWYLGSVNPLSTVPVDSTHYVEVTATPGTTYTIAIGPGSNASQEGRRVRGTSARDDYLRYDVYTDEARTNPWAPVPTPTNQVQGTGTGEVQRYPVYVRIPLPQPVTPGTYSDIVQVGVLY